MPTAAGQLANFVTARCRAWRRAAGWRSAEPAAPRAKMIELGTNDRPRPNRYRTGQGGRTLQLLADDPAAGRYPTTTGYSSTAMTRPHGRTSRASRVLCQTADPGAGVATAKKGLTPDTGCAGSTITRQPARRAQPPSQPPLRQRVWCPTGCGIRAQHGLNHLAGGPGRSPPFTSDPGSFLEATISTRADRGSARGGRRR